MRKRVVQHNSRPMTTYKTTLEALSTGSNIPKNTKARTIENTPNRGANPFGSLLGFDEKERRKLKL